MSGLTTKLEIPSGLQIKLRTGRRQLTNASRTLFDKNLNGLGISEGCSRCECIQSMQLGRVSGAKRGSNSALRVCGGAVEQRALGDNHHVTVSRGAPCSVKTSNSASHYEKARPYPLGHTLKSMRDNNAFEGAFG
jgi:hypothetical protein